jgi:hypothetical protein
MHAKKDPPSRKVNVTKLTRECYVTFPYSTFMSWAIKEVHLPFSKHWEEVSALLPSIPFKENLFWLVTSEGKDVTSVA